MIDPSIEEVTASTRFRFCATGFPEVLVVSLIDRLRLVRLTDLNVACADESFEQGDLCVGQREAHREREEDDGGCAAHRREV